MVAAVLHLGNIEFEENTDNNKGGSKVLDESENSLRIAARLLSVDCDELRQALLTKVMMTNRGGVKGTVIMYVTLCNILVLFAFSILYRRFYAAQLRWPHFSYLVPTYLPTTCVLTGFL